MDKKEQLYLTKLIEVAKQKVKKEHGIEIEKEIKIDTSKSLADNKKEIIQAIKDERDLKQKETPKKARMTSCGDEQKTKARKEEQQAQKIAEKFNKTIQCKNNDILKYYSRLRKSVELTAKGYFNSSFLHGKAGLGKSYQVTTRLNELGFTLNNDKSLGIEKNKKHYVIFSGDMSLAYLYRFLYEHNGKTIIFRDMVKLINAMRTIDIFKAVTETHGKKFVQKALYSKAQEDLPNGFVSESRFIFEMNSLHFRNDLKEDVEALLSRGDYVSTVFSFEEISGIMKQIAKTTEQKEITEYLTKNYNFVGWNNFNLRVQNKAFNIHKYAQDEGKDWKEELTAFLKSETTETRRQLYTYMGEKAVKSNELKRLLVTTHTDNCHNLRTADRRIREYVLMRELFIVGFVSDDEEALENYMSNHRKYYISLNPVPATISDTNDKIQQPIKAEVTAEAIA